MGDPVSAKGSLSSSGLVKVLPKRLGKFEIIRPLATGGMAEIYLGQIHGIEGFEKLVVVKQIRQDLAGNADIVRYFLDEVRLAATLQHPNVIQVYDIGHEDGSYFFSMEFVHGEDARSLFKKAQAEQRPIL